MLKRLYHGLALVALVNLFAFSGLLGFLLATGRLNDRRVEQIAEVLRGEYPSSQPAASQPVDAKPVAKRSRAEIAEVQAKKEFYRLIGERLESEIHQRRELNESVQLEVLRRLEEIEKRNERFQEEKKAFQEQSQQEGFQQVVDIFSKMNPKLAKDVLKSKSKDADVVRILVSMDANRRKNIINACKDESDRVWIRRILNQIQQLDQK